MQVTAATRHIHQKDSSVDLWTAERLHWKAACWLYIRVGGADNYFLQAVLVAENALFDGECMLLSSALTDKRVILHLRWLHIEVDEMSYN